MKVLLSIKPEYAKKIFDGTKKYEFRRSVFKNQNVTTVVVYASSPVQKVIGEFEIGEIFNCELDTLWALTEEYSGITKDFFYKYFSKKDKGYAIQVKNKKMYKIPRCLREEYNLHPPQSFTYIE
jgi:predicted transcriptional regulator